MDIKISQNLSVVMPEVSKETRNSLVETVLLIVVCCLFYWFVILPKKADVATKNDALSSVLSQQSKISGDLSSLKAMITQLQSEQSNIEDLDQALPLDGNTVNLQILINNFAQSVGVTVGDIEIAATPNAIAAGDKTLLSNPYGETRTLQTLSGSVSVIGSFSQLQAFLSKLETSGRLIDVSGMEMDSSSDGNLNLKLDIKAYYLGAPNQ